MSKIPRHILNCLIACNDAFMETLHKNNEGEYTKDFTWHHQQKSSAYGQGSAQATQ